jgi:hypothetical protein
LFFVVVAAGGGAAGFFDGEAGDVEEPTGHVGLLGRAALVDAASEEDEDGLGDVGGEVGVAGLTESGGVDEVEVGFGDLGGCRHKRS